MRSLLCRRSGTENKLVFEGLKLVSFNVFGKNRSFIGKDLFGVLFSDSFSENIRDDESLSRRLPEHNEEPVRFGETISSADFRVLRSVSPAASEM